MYISLCMYGKQGDSGGPYACQDQQDNWTLIGVTSFGTHTCSNSVVSRVTSYVDWIHDIIARNP